MGDDAKPFTQQEQENLPVWGQQLRQAVALLVARMEDINQKLDANNRTLRGHNGDTGIVTRITTMDSRMGAVEKRLDAILDELREMKDARADEMRQLLTEYENQKSHDAITWRYLVDKLAVPMTLAVFGFFLTVVCPALLVVVYLLPQFLGLILKTP